MFRFVSVTLLSFALCMQAAAGAHWRPSLSTEEILWWLPEDTETVMVAKGPFSVIDYGDNVAVDLKQVLQRTSYGWLSIIRHGELARSVVGASILLSVRGSRKFHPPTDLGGMLYEGCDVLIFGEGFGGARTSFLKFAESQAKAVQTIAGRKVMLFEEKLEQDLWTFYLVSPRPDVLLCATHRGYLSEVLNRMGSAGNKRALPAELPEWKQVDTTAQFWALRHYDKGNAQRDTTSPLRGEQAAANEPDKQAIGITLTYKPHDKNEALIKYLSANEAAAEVAAKYWDVPRYKLDLRISQSAPGVVEIVVNLDKPEALPVIALLLIAAFGHAVYI